MSAVACVQDHFFFVAGGLKASVFFKADAAVAIASEQFNKLGQLFGSVGKDRGCFGGALCGERIGSLAAYVDVPAALARALVWRRSGA